MKLNKKYIGLILLTLCIIYQIIIMSVKFFTFETIIKTEFKIT